MSDEIKKGWSLVCNVCFHWAWPFESNGCQDVENGLSDSDIDWFLLTAQNAIVITKTSRSNVVDQCMVQRDDCLLPFSFLFFFVAVFLFHWRLFCLQTSLFLRSAVLPRYLTFSTALSLLEGTFVLSDQFRPPQWDAQGLAGRGWPYDHCLGGLLRKCVFLALAGANVMYWFSETDSGTFYAFYGVLSLWWEALAPDLMSKEVEAPQAVCWFISFVTQVPEWKVT